MAMDDVITIRQLANQLDGINRAKPEWTEILDVIRVSFEIPPRRRSDCDTFDVRRHPPDTGKGTGT